jgi:predicted Zn-dependent protease
MTWSGPSGAGRGNQYPVLSWRPCLVRFDRKKQLGKLLEKASKAGDQAEIYFLERTSDGFQFENGRLKDLESKMQSGFSLRVIKDDCLGFAYTKNLLDRD